MFIKLIFFILIGIQALQGLENSNKESNDVKLDFMMKTLLELLKENSDLNKRVDILDNHLQQSEDTEKNFKMEYSNLVQEQNKIWQHQLDNSKSDFSVILRRQDGSLDFNRNWQDYKNGFGNPNGEFFIGLENLYTMTTYGDPQDLFIVLKDHNNVTRYAQYGKFVVGSELEKYVLKELGNYTGDAGDALRVHEGAKFSTKDEDNCKWKDNSQSTVFNGGWWFVEEQDCFLSGPYGVDVFWNKLLDNKSIKYVEMILRSTIKQVNQKTLSDISDENEKIGQTLADLNKRQETQEIEMKNFTKEILSLKKSLNETLNNNLLNHNRDWTVIQRRQDGSVDFYRNWTEYKRGFGNPNGEFFIGLEKLHAMTKFGGTQELLITLGDFDNQTRYAKYDKFVIGSEVEKYAIKDLGSYSGDAGDSLTQHKGYKFSTFDQDNDTHTKNCAESYKGAWWFYKCYHSHLNGQYLHLATNAHGVEWRGWRPDYSLKFVEMMIRSKS